MNSSTYQNRTSSAGINVPLTLKSVQLYQYLIAKPGEQLIAANARLSLLLNMTATDPLYEQIEHWYNELMLDVNDQALTISDCIYEVIPTDPSIISQVIPPKQRYDFFYTAQPIKKLAEIIQLIDEVLFKVEACYLTNQIEREVFVGIINEVKAMLSNIRIKMFSMTSIGKRTEGEGAFEAKLFLRRIREQNQIQSDDDQTNNEPEPTVPEPPKEQPEVTPPKKNKKTVKAGTEE
ncbi:hypothetical protein [uncultured Shewanella sp.]|uniref:hypothetical protein n=1 Tax=uncultured Shewanella sp. TaxID=173975 RepID=UPI00262406AF|nr:hypothetical protein [uncultured Shewanella sp.]